MRWGALIFAAFLAARGCLATPTPPPSASPTPSPSSPPTPSPAPSESPAPSASPSPSVAPSTAPLALPTYAPTRWPSSAPTPVPSPAPSTVPSPAPTASWLTVVAPAGEATWLFGLNYTVLWSENHALYGIDRVSVALYPANGVAQADAAALTAVTSGKGESGGDADLPARSATISRSCRASDRARLWSVPRTAGRRALAPGRYVVCLGPAEDDDDDGSDDGASWRACSAPFELARPGDSRGGAALPTVGGGVFALCFIAACAACWLANYTAGRLEFSHAVATRLSTSMPRRVRARHASMR